MIAAAQQAAAVQSWQSVVTLVAILTFAVLVYATWTGRNR